MRFSGIPKNMRGELSLTASLVLLSFGLSMLLPHGVGFRHPFGLPNIDLPRIAILSVNLAGVLLFLKFMKQPKRFFEPAPLIQWLLISIGVWQLLAAAYSSSPRGALLWALGNWLTLWGLAFVVISAGQSKGYWDTLVSVLKVVALLIIIWAIGEWVTQERVIIYRNTWPINVLQNSLLLKRLYTLSVGPYPNNHYIAIILCALGGFMLGCRRRYLLNASLLVVAMVATGVVAGFVAFFVMLTVDFLFKRSLAAAWPILLFLTLLATIRIVDSSQYEFVLAGSSSPNGLSVPGGMPKLKQTPTHPGSIEARSENTWSVVGQTLQHPFFGYGPGAVVDDARVPTALQSSTDLGSLFLHIAESGIPVGLFLLTALGISLVHGYRSQAPEAKSAAIGLTGFFIVSMSSAETYFWGLAFVLCGVISFYSKSDSVAPAGD